MRRRREAGFAVTAAVLAAGGTTGAAPGVGRNVRLDADFKLVAVTGDSETRDTSDGPDKP